MSELTEISLQDSGSPFGNMTFILMWKHAWNNSTSPA